MNRTATALIVIILIIGLVFAIVLSQKSTNTKQQASGLINLNKSSSISSTTNSDGTMGPKTSLSNYSNGLSLEKLGTLTVLIKDPQDTISSPAFPTRIPTVTGPNVSHSINSLSSKIQSVKSLIIQIKKAEVHLVDQNKWETLKIDNPISADLVQLQNGAVASLTMTKLSVGEYSEIRLYFGNSDATLLDDSIQNLGYSGKDWIVKIDQSFSINSNKNTTLIIDFNAQKSVEYKDGKFNLKPFVSNIIETK